jgi:sirohydrochlorin cobaltochelatase
MTPKPDSALIIVGHGSSQNPDSSTPSFDHADAITRRGLFGEVHCVFWKEEPSYRHLPHLLDREDVYIVPNFISEGYFTRTVIPRELELDGPLTQKSGRTLRYCEPVGNHPRMTELLMHRAAEVAPGVPPAETSLLIVGHGTNLNDNSAAAAKREVEKIAALGLYAEVFNTYMEEAPLISDWDQMTSQPNVVVVPFFISDGLHSYQDIPVLLGIEQEPTAAASQRTIFRNNPYRIRNRTLYYASAIGTGPLFSELILDQVEAFDREHTSSNV